MSIFSKIPITRPKRNMFDLSHDVKLTTEFGRITPFLCEPVVPGDRWQVSSNLMLRLAPMIAPVMQMFKVYQHFYYVPNRLIWDKWNEFIFGGETGISEPAYPRFRFPYGNTTTIGNLSGVSSLFDYLGFPASINLQKIQNQAEKNYFDVLPFRAYHLIWNEFYRDQNLQDEVNIGKDIDGFITPSNFEDLTDLLSLHYMSWRKDYFTSALPFAQRGPDVRLPITGDGDITFVNTRESGIGEPATTRLVSNVDANNSDLQSMYRTPIIGEKNGYLQAQGGESFNVDNSSNLRVNLEDGVRAATINEVRRSFALQKIYELAARVGARPVEQLLGFFGVKSDDARLQRPEYLGGSVVPVYIGEVLQTSETTVDGTPLATPAGVGSASASTRQFTRFFKEHGLIIGLISVVPMASYMQGLPRKYSKFTRFDHYWPQFANIGEQAILNKELFFDGLDLNENNDKEFGYTPRYAEYKHLQGSVHGDFRTSLNFWHDTRIFSGRPGLNGDFITVKPDSSDNGLNRIFAVTDTDFSDHIWLHIYNNIKAVRPMPRFGVPTI